MNHNISGSSHFRILPEKIQITGKNGAAGGKSGKFGVFSTFNISPLSV